MCWNRRRSSSTNALPELKPFALLEPAVTLLVLLPTRFTAEMAGRDGEAEDAPGAGVPPGDLHSMETE